VEKHNIWVNNLKRDTIKCIYCSDISKAQASISEFRNNKKAIDFSIALETNYVYESDF